jgi:hypothetical protein
MRRSAFIAPICLLLALLGPGCGDNDDQDTFSAAPLAGSNEVPARTTAAAGTASFTAEGTTVRFSVELSSISGVTMAHVHSGAAGTNGPIRVALYTGPVTGSVSGRLVEGTFTDADVTGIGFNELLNEMRNGMAYVNVHTTAFPDGEVRAQVRIED